LNRLIENLNKEDIQPNVFSNHPVLEVREGLNVDRTVVNTLNNDKSNSWCARSWNSIFIKAFVEDEVDGVICLQDDTNIKPGFKNKMLSLIPQYDFISAPAGDQFFYMSKEVLQTVGWWDERYIGCYCGDAEFFKRVYLKYDRTRISQFDTHNWGWRHNTCGIENYIDTEYGTKMCQPGYENQHWALDKMARVNKTLMHSQAHYRAKWGIDLDCGRPAIEVGTEQLIPDIDWYPAFSHILNFKS
jgi:hypothetical protein